jgi:hypothetical protein
MAARLGRSAADNLEKISAHQERKRAQQEAERLHKPSPEELARLFDEAASSNWENCEAELSHDDMLYLADLFTGWAMNGKTELHWSVKLLGWAEIFERLATEVGPEWDPPEIHLSPRDCRSSASLRGRASQPAFSLAVPRDAEACKKCSAISSTRPTR